MTYSSSLADDLTSLVLDASVLINLHACAYGERILSAVPNGIFVPDVVQGELEHETSKLNGEHRFLQDLVALGKVQIAVMSELEYELFGQLITGTGSLDDGEAATIAIAVRRGLLPIIDEKKGRARVAPLLSRREPACSLDLFCHPRVVGAVGDDAACEALYLALRDGRMRVHDGQCDFVVGRIGPERALQCTSLPGYRTRKQFWMQSQMK